MNQRSLANLRAPWAKGVSGNPTGNAWAGQAQEFRAEFWKICDPKFRGALIKQLCEFSMGTALEPVFDDDGCPVLNPDKSPKMQALPPERRAKMQQWATDTILNTLVGSMTFKSIDSTVNAEIRDRAKELLAAAKVLKEFGVIDRLPSDIRKAAEIVDEPKRAKAAGSGGGGGGGGGKA